MANSLRTPNKIARGLGSAKAGTGHWWLQRLTAFALVPLCVWFAASLIAMAGQDHTAVVAWIASPSVAITLVLLLAAGFWHAMLGLQVVIEDYVAGHALRMAMIVATKFGCIAIGFAGIFAVLKIAFAG